MHRGFVPIWRKSTENSLYPRHRPMTKWEAWIHILLSVNWKPGRTTVGYKVVEYDEGEKLWSIGTWAREFHWSLSKTRRFLACLENDSQIVLKSIGKMTRLTVCNWESYKVLRTEVDTDVESASEQQVNTDKEGKKEKISPPPYSPPPPPRKHNGNGKITSDMIEVVYDAYPTRCPVRGVSTGKGQKCKDKIRKLLASGDHTIASLIDVQRKYVEDCKSNDSYIKGYQTFLNNIPDINTFEPAPTTQGGWE